MAIQFDSTNRVFHLTTKHTSYLFSVFDHNYLYTAYYGRKLRGTPDLSRLWQKYPSGFSPNYEGAPDVNYALDIIPTEYPAYGGGDFRCPAVGVQFENGSRIIDPQYVSHTITDGSEELEGLPSLSGGDQTLEVLLRDEPTGLAIVLKYIVFEDIDVITRSARIINKTGAPVTVTEALSMSMDLPIADYDMIGLYGAHIRERQIDRSPMRHGTQSVGSRRGTSSHHHNPFMAFAEKTATEEQGSVYGISLIYSGNWIGRAEVDPFGGARVQMGIHPAGFAWRLADGETFVTPEAVMTYSAEGLGQMSRNFHNAYRYHLGHTKRRNVRRPIVINNWEATYFDFDEEKLLGIIESCKGLGIDTFVLDDGWFGHRDTDNSSLGDWFVHTGKLPHGLTPLIEKCEEQGMTFGLWFEPEMISEDSELYRAHPDWALKQDGRPFCRGRQQLILDLSREDVLEYLEKTVGGVLKNNRISYVKWDMNRHFTEAYSAALPPERQGEVFHRFVLNLYRFMAYLTENFPDVVFEGCSGGGGRFDPGILYYQPQIWTSDDSDAIERLKIQYGTSMVYPPQSMTAHVSASPNHQMNRVTPYNTRALVAMSASFGYEFNPLQLTDEERLAIKTQTERYRKVSDMVLKGDFYRLQNPFETNACAWMFVLPDKSKACAVYVRQLNLPADPVTVLKFRGLDPEATYHIEELDADFGGDELMYAGVALPHLWDFEATCFTLTKK
ncbi:MAG: alpha-galactosidase [Clostridia bacterium]|nr:alpha-galactosidase [Clostridia bacterium]